MTGCIDPTTSAGKTNSSMDHNNEGERKESDDSHEQDGDNGFLNEEDIDRFLQSRRKI